MIKEIQEFLGNYELKKLKTMPSRNGIAWTCDIHENGSLIGSALDNGNGGMIRLYIDDKEAHLRLEDYAKSKGFEFEPIGSFLEQGCDYMDCLKKIKTASKKKILFVTKDSGEDEFGVSKEWIVINAEFNENTKKQVLTKYKDTVKVFLNEELELLEKTVVKAPKKNPKIK